MKELQRLSRVSFPFSALILAEYDPINFPYFAEGVYRWIREEDARAGTWNRKVNYIFKQYRILIERVAQLRGRLKEESGMDVTALEAEKVGRWIIEAALKGEKPPWIAGKTTSCSGAPETWSRKKKSHGLSSETDTTPGPPTLPRHAAKIGINT